MKHTQKIVFILIFFIASVTTAALVVNITFRDFRPKGLAHRNNTLKAPKIVHTDKGRILGFSDYKNYSSGKRFIVSYKLTASLNTEPARRLMRISRLHSMRPVWVGGHGILFFTYVAEGEENRGNEVKLAAATFDYQGRFSSPVKILKRIQMPEDAYFYLPSMSVCMGNEEVLVAFAGALHHDLDENDFSGVKDSVAWFVRTDLLGNMLSETPVNIAGGSQNKVPTFYDAHYVNNAWLVPMNLASMKRVYYDAWDRYISEAQTNAFFIYRQPETDTGPARRKLFQERARAKSDFPGYNDVCWLSPDNSSKSDDATEQLQFLVYHREYLTGDDYRKYDWFVHDHFLVTVNKWGQRIAPKQAIELPQWQRQNTWKEGDGFRWATDEITKVINIDGEYYFGQTRSYHFTRDGETVSEFEHNIYRLYPDIGIVGKLATTQQNLGDYFTAGRAGFESNGRFVFIVHKMAYKNGNWVDYLDVALRRP